MIMKSSYFRYCRYFLWFNHINCIPWFQVMPIGMSWHIQTYDQIIFSPYLNDIYIFKILDYGLVKSLWNGFLFHVDQFCTIGIVRQMTCLKNWVSKSMINATYAISSFVSKYCIHWYNGGHNICDYNIFWFPFLDAVIIWWTDKLYSS